MTVSFTTSPGMECTLPGMEEKYLERTLQGFASLAFSGRDKSYNCCCDPQLSHVLIRLGKTQLCLFS